MLVSKIPNHVDIIQLHVRSEQNLILNRIKQLIDLENYKSVTLKLEEQQLPVLKKQPFLVTFNTGKSNYWLFLTRRNNRQTSVLINKMLNKMWLIPSFFPDQYYRDTILDVSLLTVKNSGPQLDITSTENINTESLEVTVDKLRGNGKSFHFLVLIHDLMVLRGKNILNQTLLSERTQFIDQLFQNYKYLYGSFEYARKPYIRYDFLESLWFDLRPTLNYQSIISGILFRSNTKADKFNYFYNIPHYLKRPEKVVHVTSEERPKSLYLLVESTNTVDTYKLYATDRDKNLKYLDIALVNDMATSKRLQSEIGKGEQVVYRCEYDNRFGAWRPITKAIDHKPDIIYGLVETLVNT